MNDALREIYWRALVLRLERGGARPTLRTDHLSDDQLAAVLVECSGVALRECCRVCWRDCTPRVDCRAVCARCAPAAAGGAMRAGAQPN